MYNYCSCSTSGDCHARPIHRFAPRLPRPRRLRLHAGPGARSATSGGGRPGDLPAALLLFVLLPVLLRAVLRTSAPAALSTQPPRTQSGRTLGRFFLYRKMKNRRAEHGGGMGWRGLLCTRSFGQRITTAHLTVLGVVESAIDVGLQCSELSLFRHTGSYFNGGSMMPGDTTSKPQTYPTQYILVRSQRGGVEPPCLTPSPAGVSDLWTKSHLHFLGQMPLSVCYLSEEKTTPPSTDCQSMRFCSMSFFQRTFRFCALSTTLIPRPLERRNFGCNPKSWTEVILRSRTRCTVTKFAEGRTRRAPKLLRDS